MPKRRRKKEGSGLLLALLGLLCAAMLPRLVQGAKQLTLAAPGQSVSAPQSAAQPTAEQTPAEEEPRPKDPQSETPTPETLQPEDPTPSATWADNASTATETAPGETPLAETPTQAADGFSAQRETPASTPEAPLAETPTEDLLPQAPTNGTTGAAAAPAVDQASLADTPPTDPSPTDPALRDPSDPPELIDQADLPGQTDQTDPALSALSDGAVPVADAQEGVTFPQQAPSKTLQAYLLTHAAFLTDPGQFYRQGYSLQMADGVLLRQGADGAQLQLSAEDETVCDCVVEQDIVYYLTAAGQLRSVTADGQDRNTLYSFAAEEGRPVRLLTDGQLALCQLAETVIAVYLPTGETVYRCHIPGLQFWDALSLGELLYYQRLPAEVPPSTEQGSLSAALLDGPTPAGAETAPAPPQTAALSTDGAYIADTAEMPDAGSPLALTPGANGEDLSALTAKGDAAPTALLDADASGDGDGALLTALPTADSALIEGTDATQPTAEGTLQGPCLLTVCLAAQQPYRSLLAPPLASPAPSVETSQPTQPDEAAAAAENSQKNALCAPGKNAALPPVWQLPSYTCTIGGVELPLPGYETDRYFSRISPTSGCRHHTAAHRARWRDICDIASGSCGCGYYNSPLLGYGIQCAGFAKLVYTALNPDAQAPGAAIPATALPGEAALLRQLFAGFAPGSYLRFEKPGGGQHYVILLEQQLGDTPEQDRLIFYHANWDECCGIDITAFSYAAITARYQSLSGFLPAETA